MGKKKGIYDENSIKVLEGREAVRERPAMYIGNTDIIGLHHLAWEVADNSIDENLAGHCNKIKVIHHKDGGLSIEDNGRGIPVAKSKNPKFKNKSTVEVVLCVLHAGGKFDKTNYEFSGGLHGVGVSCVNFLSEYLEVEICRDGGKYQQRYEKGIPKTKLKKVGSIKKTGTYIRFKPDSEIFSTVEFNFNTIKKRMKQTAFLNPGLRIEVKDENKDFSETYYYKGGIVDYLKEKNKEANTICNPIYFKEEKHYEGKDGTDQRIITEVAMQYILDSYHPHINCFTNTISNPDGGTHLSGFRKALTRTINSYAKNNDLFKKYKLSENPTGDDSEEGISVIISIKISNPQFEGQTKGKLLNSEVEGLVQQSVGQKLLQFLDENPNIAKKIVDKICNAAKGRLAARKARETIRKSTADGGTLPGKLADCSDKDPNNCEIFIVEGDSAGGCFSGDTEVALLDGRNLRFMDLEKEWLSGKENFCYSVDKNGEICVSKIKNVRKTKSDVSVIKVTLDNKKEIVCTPEHLFMLKGGSYKKAVELTNNDSLMPLYRKLSKIKNRITIEEKHESFFNHKISSIEHLSKKIDVYDLEAEETHNFALSSGVFVHNSSKQGRDRHFQAILPLRGKILNTEKARLDKILSNKEVTSLITALGTGIGKENFDKSKLRYNKIIIMCDADVDGSHIKVLILTFLFRYMKDLIKEGRVYCAVPPLYAIKKGKNIIYALTEKEKEEAISKYKDPDQLKIQRFKGLGEMNPDELWQTTMDPSKRNLKQVKINDAEEADNLFSLLMGNEVGPRRQFIYEHSDLAENIDV